MILPGNDIDNALPGFDEPTLRRLMGQFFVHSFNAIIITSPEPGFPIVYANPAFCRMTGYSTDELIGQSPRIFQGEKSNPKVLQRLKADLEAGRDFHGATINYRKNGEPYPVEWNISRVLDGNGSVSHYISIQKDLSHLKQVMSRLKNTHLHFRAFLRDLSTSLPAQKMEPAMQDIRDQLTEELLDNARLYTPALRSDDNIALFEENEFFDLSGDMNGVLAEPMEQEQISALEYARREALAEDDIGELLVAIAETQQQLDLFEYSSSKSREVQLIAANLQELANVIFYLEDFVSISTVLAELATHTRKNAERDWPPFIIDTFKALLHDVEVWVNTVFVHKTAANIHEMDASIISSSKQLMMFLP